MGKAWKDLRYRRAAEVAGQYGMRLRKMSRTHYKLESYEGWTIDIYPANKRLVSHNAPFLRFKHGRWKDLVDVVEAAITAGEITDA